VQLQPKHPPGRKRRKLRAFTAEIHRLQAEGYTCEEIRQALVESGVLVSRSTVQREAARVPQRSTPATGSATAAKPAALPVVESSNGGAGARTARQHADDPRTSRQIAEDFMKGQVINPLLRAERTSG
jgi:hypothetical protein